MLLIGDWVYLMDFSPSSSKNSYFVKYNLISEKMVKLKISKHEHSFPKITHFRDLFIFVMGGGFNGQSEMYSIIDDTWENIP